MSNKKVVEFEGKAITVSWDGRLCLHVGECTRAGDEPFVIGREPWCQPDHADADRVAEVVSRCPSGALTYTRKDGGVSEATPFHNVATVASNGPLYLEGDLRIEGAPEDMPGVRRRAALCRCGDSGNKPFCDNTHEAKGFRDRGAVGPSGGEHFPSTGGPLKITRTKNGPLLVSGNLVLRTGAGREAWHGTKAALCRCGQSKNKPFCDGAHKTVGFEAD